MTRISITLAAASLTLSLAPAANAYQTEIDVDALSKDAAPINVLFAEKQSSPAGTCSTDITPVLAAALGLTAQETKPSDTVLFSRMACNEK